MVFSPSWRDHFKIDDSLLEAFWEDFSQSSPMRASEMNPATAEQSIEFVLWCVQQGHFTEEAYTSWQSQAFEIPVIRRAFFDAPTDMAFWDRVKELHPWSATCMPLAEWDDVLLVGIANPKIGIELAKRHRVMLATPTALREFFERVDHASISNPKISIARNVVAETPFVAKVDDGDPFAALSRELGLLDQKTPAEEHGLPAIEIDPHNAPAGLVIPEGLTFDSAELSRLNNLDPDKHGNANGDEHANHHAPMIGGIDDEQVPEGGTLIHNFETGKNEIVDKPTLTGSISFAAPPETPKAPAQLSIEPIPEPPSLDSHFVNAEDDPLAALVMPAPPVVNEAAKPGVNSQIPGLPFSMGRTPDSGDEYPAFQNETVSQASPFSEKTFGQKPALAVNDTSIPGLEELDQTNPSAVIPNPEPIPQYVAKPSPTATTDQPISPELELAQPDAPVGTARIRKPLFEPASSAAPKMTGNAFEPRSASRPGFDATKAVAIKNSNASAQSEDTQTGVKSGTQTKSRKLDPTPVTSMFGNVNPAIHQERGGGAGNPAYLNKSIAVGTLDPIHLDQCRSIDEAGAQAIMQACNLFETGMILLFKDGDLLPWKWNDLFLSVHGDKPAPINLVEPSIFKVVFRTAKPYHGYVVTSEVNQKFFNEFYRGMLPKHATVIPVMIEGRMGGMLLGFTNSKIDYRQSLRLMERLSFDLSRVFKTLRGTMSRAS